MRDINQLHPRAKEKAIELVELCKKNGIAIKINECLRTKAEQDALYAKGRTVKGSIVTNCSGSSYSSMHQWGIAFDIYLDMDIDGDGKKSDDAFNNSTKLFDKVGYLGQSIGLEWGGSWKSIKDRPHFQLPDWGSTASKLKKMYGTPEKFMATWNNQEKKSVATSQPMSYVVGGNYTTKVNLNVRTSAAGNLKKWDKMTVSGKSHSLNQSGYAVLKKNTVVTCKEIKTLGESIWMRIPSGWICARSGDKVYIG